MSAALGTLEAQLFAHVQMRGLRTIGTGDLVHALGITRQQERELFSRLARRRMITRVRRGLYLVPPRLPPGGRWSPSEFLALATLIADQGGKYQICGPNAFSRFGWDDQVPNRLYAYNNRISGERTVGATALTLIKVSDDRLGETETFRTPDETDAVFSSRTRSLVDAVYDWARFNSLPRAYGWIRAELARDQALAPELVRVARQYANLTTLRRLGKLMEQEGVEEGLLRELQRQLTPSSSLIPWIPGRPKRGTADHRWGVVVNAEA